MGRPAWLGTEMKVRIILIFLSVWMLAAMRAGAETAGVGDAATWTQAGQKHYEHCEFKDAAKAFLKALQFHPKDARLHHWLGKSYAKMAEVATLLHASKDARRARVNLEEAVDLDPRNREYLRSLFDFYLDSPEWFGGGLDRAALLVERIEPDDPGAQAFLRQLVAGARQEYRSMDWKVRQVTLLPAAPISRVAP